MKRPAESDDDEYLHNQAQQKEISINQEFELVNGSSMDNITDKVAILDCGAQYGKVIDRRVRELCVESDLLPLDTPLELIKGKYKAVILSGGPKSVYASDALTCDPRLFTSGIPILGICYGFQLINKEFGGTVEKRSLREDGQHEVKLDTSCLLFKGLKDVELVLLTHGDSLVKLADGFRAVGSSGNITVAIGSDTKKIYGLQFHPEVDLTSCGKEIFKNFLITIVGCRTNFTIRSREEHCLEYIKHISKDKKVLLLCSGGVDSTVCAALLNKALGKERVTAIHIDNGFMRKNESHQVRESLRSIGVHLRVFSRDYIFYNATTKLTDATTGEPYASLPLCRVTDPEIKRRIIGDAFVGVMNDVMKRLKLNPDEFYIGQGTLRPDLIESASLMASGKADAIKTHHNDTALVRELRAKGRVIEPLKDFHKDEVRLLGRDLGLPEVIVARHPFPGPGLAIRILCRTEPYMCAGFNETQTFLKVIVQFAKCYEQKSATVSRVKDCFSTEDTNKLLDITRRIEFSSTLLPVQTVGVQGDCRSYSYAAALSTNHRPYPWAELLTLARLIPQTVHKINRVTFIFGQAIEHNVLDVTPTLLTSTPIAVVREADNILTTTLTKFNVVHCISQAPTVLLPLHFDRPPLSVDHPSVLYSLCLRPFVTNDFMTGICAVPDVHLKTEIIDNVVFKLTTEVPIISRVMYDLTSKPPGTTEWE